MRQLPLLENGSNLASPMFTPRPGWGGKLHRWLGENFLMSAIRLVLLVAVVVIFNSLLRARTSPVPAITASPIPVTESDTLSETAMHGDGMYALATRAVDEYLAQHSEVDTLAPVEHTWAVYRLVRSVPSRTLRPGDTVDFNAQAVAQTIAAARSISALTRASLMPYLR